MDLKSIIGTSSAPADILQVVIGVRPRLIVIGLKWRDLMLFCFDPNQARSLGRVGLLHITWLLLLSAMAVAALQAVGAMVRASLRRPRATPGATAYLLTDRFGPIPDRIRPGRRHLVCRRLCQLRFDGATGGCIVTLQALVFLAVLVTAPKSTVS